MEIEHRDALAAAVGALERLGVDYFLFGANAQNVWGDPRYTKDADLILVLPDERFGELLDALLSVGYSVKRDEHRTRLRSGRMLKLPFGGITVDFVLGETEFDRSALTRRRRVNYVGIDLWVGSAEDIVLYKLIAHRMRDLADIESIVRRQRANLDLAYLRKWARWLADATGFKRIETTLRSMWKRYGKPRR